MGEGGSARDEGCPGRSWGPVWPGRTCRPYSPVPVRPVDVRGRDEARNTRLGHYWGCTRRSHTDHSLR